MMTLDDFLMTDPYNFADLMTFDDALVSHFMATNVATHRFFFPCLFFLFLRPLKTSLLPVNYKDFTGVKKY